MARYLHKMKNEKHTLDAVDEVDVSQECQRNNRVSSKQCVLTHVRFVSDLGCAYPPRERSKAIGCDVLTPLLRGARPSGCDVLAPLVRGASTSGCDVIDPLVRGARPSGCDALTSLVRGARPSECDVLTPS